MNSAAHNKNNATAGLAPSAAIPPLQAIANKLVKHAPWGPASLGRREALRRHFAITVGLDAPGVVHPDQLQAHADGLTLTAPWTPGIDLEALMASLATGDQPARLPVPEVLEVAARLAAILDALEHQGIAHGSLQPQHVVLERSSGRVGLINFGQGQFVRSPALGGLDHVPDHRDDLRALGQLLFWMATGRRLHLMPDQHARDAAAGWAPEDIGHLNERFIGVISRLLDARTSHGYRSAEALAEDLRRAQAGEALGPLGRPHHWAMPVARFGRGDQVNALVDAFAEARPMPATEGAELPEGRCVLAVVDGRSGIGKTAVTVAAGQLMARQGARVAMGKFNQFGNSRPLWALTQALDSLLAHVLDDTEPRRAAVVARLRSGLGDLAAALFATLPRLELLLGPQPAVPALGGEARRVRFELLMRRLVAALASAEVPLVLVMDDLQWADAHTLDLLRGFTQEPTMRHVLIVGAYRSEAVAPGHPLLAMLDRVQAAGNPIRRVTVHAWSSHDIVQLLLAADLRPGPACARVAEFLHQQTQGNPMAVLQALRVAEITGAATFDESLGQWQIDPDQAQLDLQGRSTVDLVGHQVSALSPECLEVLCIGAHLGANFDAQMLAAATLRDEGEVLRLLWPALARGFVLPMDEAAAPGSALSLRLSHDTVQQAAYGLEDSAHNAVRHLRIGRALLASYGAIGQLQAHMFEVVQQFNSVPSDEISPAEREQLSSLNSQAGRAQRASGSNAAALQHFQQAMRMMPADEWEQHPERAFAAVRDAAEAAYLAVHFSEMDQLLDELDRHPLDAVAAAQVQELRIQGLLARNRLGEALALGQTALANLGEPLLPLRDPSQWPQVPDVGLLEPGASTPARIDTALRLLVWLTPCAFITSFEMYARVILTMIDLAQRYPSSALTPISYTNYGLTLCGMGRNEDGFTAGELALTLSDRVHDEPLRCKVWTLTYGFLQHWRRPALQSLSPLLKTFEDCLVCGDQEYLGYAAFLYCDKAWALQTLGPLEDGHGARAHLVSQFGHDFSWRHSLVWLQFIRSLRGNGQPGSELRLNGTAFSEERDIPHLEAAQNSFSLFTAHTLRAWLAWHRGDPTAALQASESSERYAMNGTATLLSVDRVVVHSLALLHLATHSAPDEHAAALEKVDAMMAQLERWAQVAPANVSHKVALVQAERARAQGDTLTALHAYELAMELAEASDFMHDRALAAERAGEFHLALNQRNAAGTSLRRAYRHYMHWGATAVAESLLLRHPWLSELEAPPSFAFALDLNDKLSAWLAAFRAHRVVVWADDLGLRLSVDLRSDGGLHVSRQLTTALDDPAWPAGLRRRFMSCPDAVCLMSPAEQPAWLDDPYFQARQPAFVAALPIIRAGAVVGMACMEASGERLFASNLTWSQLGWHAQSVVDELRVEVLNHQLASSTQVDDQTGLPNRSAFTSATELSLSRTRTSPGRATVVLAVRVRHLDRSKLPGGARQAREALGELVDRVRRRIGGTPIVAHLDRLSFGVLLQTNGDMRSTMALAQSILAALEQPTAGDLHLEIDLAVCADAGIGDAEALLSNAELALQSAPGRGPGAVVLYDASVHRASSERDAMERDLRWAIHHQGLRLVYQPIVNMKDCRLMGVEALVRWRHPVWGEIPAWQIIELAETTGLIRSLGRWVTDALVAQAALWGASPEGAALNISFNVSPIELVQDDYASYLLGALHKHGVPTNRIALEITESTSLQDEVTTQANLRALSEGGITLCIDDFGVGSSSLGRLHAVVAQRLKIDRSFIDGLPNHAGRRTTVQMIIRLADALKLDVVAEGVSTATEASFLLGEGLVKAQGFYYAQPLELPEMSQALQRGVVQPSKQ